MRNHVTGEGGGGEEDGEWQEPPGVPQGVLLGPLEVTRPRPLKSHLISGSRALTQRAVINACLWLHLHPWPERSTFERQTAEPAIARGRKGGKRWIITRIRAVFALEEHFLSMLFWR